MANPDSIKGQGFHTHPERINKKGRPKKLPQLDVLLADILGDEKDGVTAAEAILKALRAKAARGDIRAAEVLLDRGYGKAVQNLNHSGETKIELIKTIIRKNADS